MIRRALCVALWLSCLLTLAVRAEADRSSDRAVLVFAAASLTDVLEEIGRAYTMQTKRTVRFSFAASSTLAKQIELGASAELFISADAAWMDYLQQRRLIDPSTRRDLVANRLVLIAPLDGTLELRIEPKFALAKNLRQGRLAIGDPDIVPAGRYAREALLALGVWDDVKNRLVYAENVRTALTYVTRGETPLGVVYETDARIEKRVRVLDRFPENTHSPIVYPAAAVSAASPEARAFLDYLSQANARAIFRRHGFQKPATRARDQRVDVELPAVDRTVLRRAAW